MIKNNNKKTYKLQMPSLKNAHKSIKHQNHAYKY